MSEQLLRPKLENIISGHNINQDDADWLRAALAQPAEGGEAHQCHVYNVTKTGSLCEWEPTAHAFAMPDGKHALYTAPPASQEQAAYEPAGFLLHWPAPGGGREIVYDESRIAGDAIGCPVTEVFKRVAVCQEQAGTCGACDGSGRMVRDPDIGTDQECFACDGSGKASQEQADALRSCPEACRSPEKCCNFGCQKASQEQAQQPKRSPQLGALLAVTTEKNKLKTALELACGYLTDEQVAEIAKLMPPEPQAQAHELPDLSNQMTIIIETENKYLFNVGDTYMVARCAAEKCAALAAKQERKP